MPWGSGDMIDGYFEDAQKARKRAEAAEARVKELDKELSTLKVLYTAVDCSYKLTKHGVMGMVPVDVAEEIYELWMSEGEDGFENQSIAARHLLGEAIAKAKGNTDEQD